MSKKEKKAEVNANETAVKVKSKKKKNKGIIKKTIQELLPVEKFFDNGIIQVSADEYSKAYLMNDANFMAETEPKQENILKEYKKILK